MPHNLVQQMGRSVSALGARGVASISTSTVRGSSTLMRTLGEAIIESFDPRKRPSRTLFERAHREVAQAAAQAASEAYDVEIEGNKLVPSYRVGERNRLGGGVLERAIKGGGGGLPGWIHATFSGVAFPDDEYLNTAAKHWRRVMWGAEPSGDPRQVTAELRFGTNSGTIFLQEEPTANMTIPIGVFGDGESPEPGHNPTTQPFFPRKNKMLPTVGIPSGIRDVFDDALHAAVQEFPRAYDKLGEAAVRSAITRSQGILKGRL